MNTEMHQLQIEIMGKTTLRLMVALCDCFDCRMDRHEEVDGLDEHHGADFTVEIITSEATTVINCLDSVQAEEVFNVLFLTEGITAKGEEKESIVGKTIAEATNILSASKYKENDNGLFSTFVNTTKTHANCLA